VIFVQVQYSQDFKLTAQKNNSLVLITLRKQHIKIKELCEKMQVKQTSRKLCQLKNLEINVSYS
jgi:hypothetical protein